MLNLDDIDDCLHGVAWERKWEERRARRLRLVISLGLLTPPVLFTLYLLYLWTQ
jgi:hypothetical protein